MSRFSRYVLRLIGAVWFGGGLILLAVAAPAAFWAAASRTAAADMVGAMLARWHYLAIAAPLILLIAEWRWRKLSSAGRVLLLSVALLLAAGQIMTDLRIRSIRAHAVGPISSLHPDNPTRRRFGMLHGVSTLLMGLQIIAAAGVLYPERDGEGG